MKKRGHLVYRVFKQNGYLWRIKYRSNTRWRTMFTAELLCLRSPAVHETRLEMYRRRAQEKTVSCRLIKLRHREA